MEVTIKNRNKRITGEITVPGDKSISHRAVLFGAIARGLTEIEGFLMGEDCLSSVSCVRSLGIDVSINAPGNLTVRGQGLYGLKEPLDVLDAGNSGTTTRLILGILAGQPFHSVIKGDASLNSRPMGRVVNPLKQMGAVIDGREAGNKAPLAIRGSGLQPITYQSPVASAQVKSAVLLAGLYAEGETTFIEPSLSRDHTERMLSSFGADIHSENAVTKIKGLPELTGQKIIVPGDISSAAFFMAAAAIIPDSHLMIMNVGVNPSRTGIIDVLLRMGAKITLHNQRWETGEPVADIEIVSGPLKGTVIEKDEIPRLIDEIPAIAVVAAHAEGTTVIRDAKELRVKETDRIAVVAEQMGKLGMDIIPQEDGMIINGGKPLHGAVTESKHDHRIAMALAVAGISAPGTTMINDAECVDISFPGFYQLLSRI